MLFQGAEFPAPCRCRDARLGSCGALGVSAGASRAPRFPLTPGTPCPPRCAHNHARPPGTWTLAACTPSSQCWCLVHVFLVNRRTMSSQARTHPHGMKRMINPLSTASPRSHNGTKVQYHRLSRSRCRRKRAAGRALDSPGRAPASTGAMMDMPSANQREESRLPIRSRTPPRSWHVWAGHSRTAITRRFTLAIPLELAVANRDHRAPLFVCMPPAMAQPAGSRPSPMINPGR